jgi:hypothetical protein
MDDTTEDTTLPAWDVYWLDVPRQDFLGTYYAADKSELRRQLEDEYGNVAIVPAAE